MSYIIGCDIGTTSVKAVAFSLTGDVLASENASYPMFHPEPRYAEQDPNEIYSKTIGVLQKLITAMGNSPVALSFSSAMHSLMALDQAGSPASPLIIWADNRSGALADELRQSEKGRAQYRRTGVPVHAMTPACKFLWIQQFRPSDLFNAPRYAGIKDFVIARLTGELVTDYSMAAATGMLNLESLQWDAETLRAAGISTWQLPEIVPPYYKLSAKEGNGFLSGVPVVVGGSDGCLANLGSGASGLHTMALTIGTSAAVRKTVSSRHLDPQMRTFCYPLDKEIFIVGGPTNNGGVVFQWLKDNFFADLSFDEIIRGTEQVSPGADGLFFFPYLLGERAPLWDSLSRGCFHGIDIEHTRFHFARAVMEGILMNLYVIAQPLLSTGEVKKIYANGGFAQSEVFVKMLADIFGTPVALNVTNDAGCIGAAMIGLRSLGKINEFSEAEGFVKVAEVIDFDREQHAQYKRIFSMFTKLLETNSLRSGRV